MQFTRRTMLMSGVAAVAVSGLGVMPAYAALDDEIAKITGGAETVEGALSITAPEIAENGNTVPIEVSAPGAKSVSIFADGNPVPNVATFNFGPLNASRSASTRIRLAGTQNVVAVAAMEDGTFQRASAEVKVTIGGCGG